MIAVSNSDKVQLVQETNAVYRAIVLTIAILKSLYFVLKDMK